MPETASLTSVTTTSSVIRLPLTGPFSSVTMLVPAAGALGSARKSGVAVPSTLVRSSDSLQAASAASISRATIPAVALRLALASVIERPYPLRGRSSALEDEGDEVLIVRVAQVDPEVQLEAVPGAPDPSRSMDLPIPAGEGLHRREALGPRVHGADCIVRLSESARP